MKALPIIAVLFFTGCVASEHQDARNLDKYMSFISPSDRAIVHYEAGGRDQWAFTWRYRDRIRVWTSDHGQTDLLGKWRPTADQVARNAELYQRAVAGAEYE